MRNLALGCIAALMLAAVPQTAEAGGGAYFRRFTIKLAHGVTDLVYSPFELLISPVTHAIDFDRHYRPATWGGNLGLLVGLVKTEARLIRGSSDLVTCLFPSERFDKWEWEWSFGGFQRPLSEPTYEGIEDAS